MPRRTRPATADRFATLAIHAGQAPDPTTGAIMTPIYATSTYVQEKPGVHKGYDYSRTNNPTRAALESNLAALEGARYGLAFSSGCGAADTLLGGLLKTGDHVVSGSDVYGGTYRLFTRVFRKFGVDFTFVDTSVPGAIEGAWRPATRLLWLESPSNPLLKITDLRAACGFARKHGAVSVVDNTFATPVLQQPLSLGASVVLHSTTKYLGGHSDTVGGALLMNDRALWKELKYFQNAIGAIPGPFDSWLVLRGTKTVHVRVERACENARRIAAWLSRRPEVTRIHYPGLRSDAGHAVAKKQMKDFGAMISFDMRGTLARSVRFISSTRLFALAESLGGVESLIEHPASMTHGSIPREERLKSGLTDGLVRLSVGIEDVRDLVADLEQALKR
ncbi:MAG: cystathionine gamma-synthase [Candidatus Brocadiae bacterium]|nr:cystathionine gamma-synthase [Candidatus Brocadiia bacterium]